MNEILIYTAVFGGRDPLRFHSVDGCDSKIITDVGPCEDPNVILTQLPFPESPRKSARLFKILCHLFFPNYKRWVWIDGSMVIRSGTTLERISGIKGPVSAMQHEERDCIYKEAEVCANAKLDDPEVIGRQIRKYRKEGYPSNNGLVGTGLLVRDNTPEVRALNTMWWNELAAGSIRDQLSFNYVAWKLGIKVGHHSRCSYPMPSDSWFEIVQHSKVVPNYIEARVP